MGRKQFNTYMKICNKCNEIYQAERLGSSVCDRCKVKQIYYESISNCVNCKSQFLNKGSLCQVCKHKLKVKPQYNIVTMSIEYKIDLRQTI